MMNKTIKHMDIKEFREQGFLQEANRLYFHPLGLALGRKTMINRFDEDYRFLSNFWLTPIVFERETYPSTEHAYQAAKTLDKEARMAIRGLNSPGKAKRAGMKVALRPDWESIKNDIMLNLIREKFKNPELKQKLIDTKDEELVEGNTWGDMYWGMVEKDGQWVGENMLGKMLMQVRYEITI